MTQRRISRTQLAILTGSMCLTLAGCGKTAAPVPEQNGAVTPGPQSPNVPVAAVPDGSAANTGNVVNGPQQPVQKK